MLRQQEAMFAQARVEQAQEEWLQMQQSLQQQGGVHQIPQSLPSTSLTPSTSSPLETQISNKNSIATSVIKEPINRNNQEHANSSDPVPISQT